MSTIKQIRNICNHFNIDGRLRWVDPIMYGHINSTYEAFFDVGDHERIYIIQKINQNVFKKPEEVMENIFNVTRYIIDNAKSRGEDAKTISLHFKRTNDDQQFYIDEKGDYWRCYRFVENSKTYQSTNNLKIIEETGKAFGKFQKELKDFDANILHETIVDFHNTLKRYEQLEQAVKENKALRLDYVRDEVEEYKNLKDKAIIIHNMVKNKELPLRVTHNDTKCNNVLFDCDTDEYLTVIDLDTVMPGLYAFDFGDAIRFACNTAEEDEEDLAKVRLDMKKFEAFTKGFLSEVKDSLTEKEKETLVLGAITMTIECGTRFLADYLNGDTYFRVDKINQNLHRARCQLKLALDMIDKEEKMNAIVKKYL